MNYIKKNKQLIKSVLSISLPAIGEMSLNTLVGIADTLMISYFISAEALTAAGYANQIFFTIIFVFSSFNVGATAMISRNYGEKNYSRLNQILGQNMTLNIVIGMIIMLLSLTFGHQFMKIFDTSRSILNMGTSYFNIVSYSLVFMFISFAAAASLRGVSDTRTPMLITLITNILNIIGNYVLMTGFWIFPNMGIDGAAVSTTLSRLIGVLLYAFVLLNGRHHLKLLYKNLRASTDILKPLWNFSYTAGIEQLLMQVSFVAVSVIISSLDTTSEAAFRILLNIESLSFMPAIGFSIAAASLVGKSLGEQDQEKALHTGYISCGLGIIWGIFIGLIFALFPSQIIGFFTNDRDIINASISTMLLAGLDQPFLGFIIIISGALRGAGDTKSVMVLNSFRLWVVFVPLCYIFVTFLGMGIISVWVSELCALIIFNFILFKRFQSEKWSNIDIN
ncbi:MATE family efflux transporter [Petroclostridium sp. X23]|uniref:MATE family efflux transporter n=1 Tax=Petroclostridium sp. X23 TaxID=3045146 RepID=UPI0024AD22A6|nr:MATE family efflux transporter [Petroclostridium sp. X23]WHH60100.1 MATE family efflux transporter [Petroclostridium sp. X23]